MSARLPPPPQKPRHIAPAIHVLATRLAQNTADRLTIGNTPLHILHLCDARYLAPLFPKCRTLTAITVHLRYVASATALEVFLQAAATSPSLRDVFLIGGVTAMEAAAISTGLAAFTFAQVAGASGAHIEAALSVSTALGAVGDRVPRQSPFPSPAAPPSAAELRAQPSFSAKKRRQKQTTSAAPLASPTSTSAAAAALSPLQRSYGGRPLFFFQKSTPHTPSGFSQGGLHRRPASSNASRVSSCLASPTVKSGVRVTLELHKVNEEIGAVLLEGLRRGTRILCTTIHLCVGSADARLAGLRLAQQMKQAAQVHRQQQPPWLIGVTPQWTPLPPRTPPNISAAKTHNNSARGASWRQQRVTSALQPPPPSSPSHIQAAGGAPRLDAPPSPSFTRYAVWNLRANEPVVAPHTPPFARAAVAPALVEEVPAATSSDFFRRRGRHFLSSERGGASTPVDVVRQAWVSAAPLKLRAVSPPAVNAPHTPNPHPASLAARQQPPRAAHRSHTAVSTLRSNNSSGSRTASSSSFSPIVAGTLLGFCRGRSASFSSWSSRSTSPQPRRPAPPDSPAARAYAALARRERRDPLHQPPPSLWTRQANRGLQPRTPLSPYVPVSAALCSPRYLVRRGGDDVHRMAAPCDGPHTQLSAPSHMQQNRTQRSTCSCFVCAPPPPPTSQQQVAPARHTQPSKAQPGHHLFPHTPTQPRRPLCEGVWHDDASAAHPRPVLPSPLASPSIPLSLLEASPPAVMHNDAAVAQTPRPRRSSHMDCHVLLEDAGQSTTAADRRSTSVKRKTSEGTCSDSASTPGITARTPGAPSHNRRRISTGSSHRRVPSVVQHTSCRCVSHTRLPSSPESSVPCGRAALTSPETPGNSDGQSDSSGSSGEGYVVYPNALKFLRARVAEINRHVVWHQVKAAKEAEEHAKHLAALEVTFAGRVTTQLSDILMVLTDMEHGSRSGRAVRC